MPIISGADALTSLDRARSAIFSQLEEREADFPTAGPAWPWNLVVQVHSYVFDLPTERLRQIRLHADAINATMSVWHYAMDARGDGVAFAKTSGYAFLGEGIPSDLWAREYPVPSMEDLQLGYRFHDIVLNAVTVPRQQNACNIYRLVEKRRRERHIFVEIGGGYGSFALDMRRILPNCAYVIADLPETLIFSASYLISHRPDLRFYVYAPGDDLNEVLKDTDAFDFAFVPNHRAHLIDNLPHVDIGYNSISFPEMSLESVRQYLGVIAPKLRGFFMSVNLRYPHDRTIARPGTDDTLAEYFRLFPRPQEYRSQLNLSADHYDHPDFRPVFIGNNEHCRPLKQTELRMFYHPNIGPVTVQQAFGGSATIRL